MDINSQSYQVVYEYMIRLKKEDLTDTKTLKKPAKIVNISPKVFKKRFGYLVGP